MPRFKPIFHAASFIIIALITAAVIFYFTGYDVASIGNGLVEGAITGPGSFTNTIRWAIPLAVIGLGVAVCFRAGFFNVGAQGQMYIGTIAGSAVALLVPGPKFFVISAALITAMIAGAGWSLIAGVLKVYTGADEVLTTLMLNFIGVLVLDYAAGGPLKDPSGAGQVAASERVAEGLRISGASGVSFLLVAITVALGGLVWLWMSRTKGGLASKLAGRNPVMVRWQGGKPDQMVLGSFAFAGATAGLAGAMHVLGPAGRFTSDFSADVGFTSVLVALVGLLSVPGVLISAIFFGGLQSALQYLPVVSDLPRAALEMIQGIIAVMITLQLRKSLGSRRQEKKNLPPAARVKTKPRGENADGVTVGRNSALGSQDV